MADKLSAAARAFLEEPRFAVLATVDADGSPQQTVIWYAIMGDEIMFNTLRGRVKDRNMVRNPHVSLCVEDGYRYITIKGRVSENDDQQAAQEDIKRLAVRYHGPEQGEKRAASFANQQRISYRVPLDDVGIYGFGE
ncbi:MAG: PPOX class F420-dependent oxidoreductase [Chloroflexia bacterium]